MAARSVIRQWSLLAVAAIFVLPFAMGLLWVVGAAVDFPGLRSPVLVGLGLFLMLLSVAVITACLLSLTIRATAGPPGIASGEVGARWSFGWGEIAHVWLVRWREQLYLAVLPASGAASARSRTSWRSRRMRLPEDARTVRVSPDSVEPFARAVAAHRGVPPEPHAG